MPWAPWLARRSAAITDRQTIMLMVGIARMAVAWAKLIGGHQRVRLWICVCGLQGRDKQRTALGELGVGAVDMCALRGAARLPVLRIVKVAGAMGEATLLTGPDVSWPEHPSSEGMDASWALFARVYLVSSSKWATPGEMMGSGPR